MSDSCISQTAFEKLISNLPELYQPIFGHSEYASAASRSCEDRLSIIREIYLQLAEREGRPLKVLDLGCAQGFFSLSLSALGAIVTGIDYSQPNIDVCKKLAAENPSFKIEFSLGSIDTFVNNLERGQYDLVLGLSVFHHLIYEHGLEYVREIFDKLVLAAENGLFEFALSNEPLYWAASQPDRPRDLLCNYAFSHRVSSHATHLSAIHRPMYFASSRYWLIDSKFGLIDEARHEPHRFEGGFHKKTRKYILSDKLFIKILRFDGDNSNQNKKEYQQEVAFLTSPPEGFVSPTLFACGANEEEGWIIRSLVPGCLLCDLPNENLATYDKYIIVGDILSQLATLERERLFHSDVRSWNVLITPDGRARLIDFGAISGFVEDGDDRYGQILSVINTIGSIVELDYRQQNSQRPRFVSPAHFSDRFARWLRSLWLTPSHRWSFQLLNKFYIDSQSADWKDDSSPAKFTEISNIIESFLSTFSNKIGWDLKEIERVYRQQAETKAQLAEITAHLAEAKAKQVEAKTQLAEIKAQHAETEAQQSREECRYWRTQAESLHEQLEAKTQLAEIKAQHAETEAQQSREECRYWRTQAESLHEQLLAVHASTSWRVTAPFRIVSRAAARVLAKKDT